MTAQSNHEEITPFRRAMILYTLTSTVALYALTVTIANVALPQMQGAFAATQDQIALVVTGNIVATAVATPLTGWFTARFGQRRMVLGCIGLFTLFTLLCGLAPNLESLVIFRVLQGGFGAPLAPLSQAIVLSVYPQSKHGSVTAIFGMGVVLGPIFAPTLGGFLSEEYGWAWVFFMIVPFGLASLFACWVFVFDSVKGERTRFDWTGFLALSLAIASLQLLLARGQRYDWLDSPEIVIEIIAACFGLYIFIAHSFTADKPFLSPALLKDRNFVLGVSMTFIFGMVSFTPMTLLPNLLQDLRGFPDSLIGILLGVRGIGSLLGFIILFYGNKLDPRIWLFLGFGLQVLSGYQMAQFDINLTILGVASASFLQGVGSGFLWVPLTLVTFNTLPQTLFPQGSSVYHLLRNFGSSIHISVSVALVIYSSTASYANMSEYISPFAIPWTTPFLSGGLDLNSTSELAKVSGELKRQSVMVGYINAFYFFALTGLATFPLILMVKLKKQDR